PQLPQAPRAGVRARRERRRQARAEVSARNPPKGVGRDGAQGVGTPHSTAEAGERTRTDPAEGRGRRAAEPWEGNRAGAQKPDPVSTKQQRLNSSTHTGKCGYPASPAV